MSNKIQQTDQQANNNKKNEKIISDLNAALNFEKEKSLNIEQALQSVTEHEKELKEKIRTMEETSKNKVEKEEIALEEKEKEIAELTANLEAIELKNIYGLNPMAKEFIPRGKHKVLCTVHYM